MKRRRPVNAPQAPQGHDLQPIDTESPDEQIARLEREKAVLLQLVANLRRAATAQAAAIDAVVR